MPSTTEQAFLDLLRAGLTGQPAEVAAPDKEVLMLAAQHDLSHLVGDVLYKAGALKDDEVSKNLKKMRYIAITRYEQLRYELEALTACLSEAEIPFMPLKGAVIRALYPEPWMRTSCDIDVLVHPEDTARAQQVLCDKLGYRRVHEGSHDIVLFAPSDVHVELHFDMVEPGRAVRANDVLQAVWEHSEGDIHRRMSDAMFYFYHVAHMAKHVETGGCGVRTFVDLWLLEHCDGADNAGRAALLEAGGLTRFSQVATELSEHWFAGTEASEAALMLEAFILRGGTYGTVSTGSAVRQRRRSDRWVSLFTTVFPPYRELKMQYPVLQKHPYLYPGGLVYRIASKWFGRGRRRAVKRFQQMAAVSKKERAVAATMMDELGLTK